MHFIKSSSFVPADGGALILRLALGAVMLAHAAAKYFIFTLAGTAAFFTAQGFPGWMALPVFALEAIGGLLLWAGWQVRWTALALVPVMLGAWCAHAGNGWMFTAPNGGWEYPAFLVAALGVQALLGAGAYRLGHGQGRGMPRAVPAVRNGG